jgi:hypothetical protein
VVLVVTVEVAEAEAPEVQVVERQVAQNQTRLLVVRVAVTAAEVEPVDLVALVVLIGAVAVAAAQVFVKAAAPAVIRELITAAESEAVVAKITLAVVAPAGMEVVQTTVLLAVSGLAADSHKVFIGPAVEAVVVVDTNIAATPQAVRVVVVEGLTQTPLEQETPEAPQIQQPLTAYQYLREAHTLLA